MKIGTAQSICRGETICGDAFTILEESGLIAVVDGLGHGPKAGEAAQLMCEYIQHHPDMGLPLLMESASKKIKATRGAVAAIIRITPIDSEKASLAFVGIGNIDLHAMSQESISPVSLAGVVGRHIRKIKEFEYVLHKGDLLIIHTDGISSRLDIQKYERMSVQETADAILKDHGKNHDDATCVVIRY